MKLFLFPALTLALSGAADAVSCYSSSGGPSCATYNGLWTFHGDYCDHYWTRSSMDYLYFDSASGHQARIRHTGGQFANQQQCLSVTGDIINQCFGLKNGGTQTIGSVNVNINFCIA